MLPGQDKKKHLDQIRKDIRDFKAANKLDKVTLTVILTRRPTLIPTLTRTLTLTLTLTPTPTPNPNPNI